jgi:rsbT antagonist protein RsbS
MEHEISRLPIIKIWDQILVPLQGEVTDRLAERLSQEVLDAVHEHGAAGLVIDVTGVWMIDSHLCAVLSHLASCARLMGTRTIISGLSPEIALTLQTMGVELQSMQTALTVEQALEMLGLRVTRPGTKKAGAAGEQGQGKDRAGRSLPFGDAPSEPPREGVESGLRGTEDGGWSYSDASGGGINGEGSRSRRR